MARRSVTWVRIFLTAILVLVFSEFALAQEDQVPEAGCTQHRSFLQCSKIPDISGSYTGSLTDADSGRGTITLTIEQKGTHITGVWGTSYPNGEGNSGALTGTVSKKAVHAKLTTRIAHCFYTVLVSIGADSFQGTFVDSRRCPEEDSGSLTIPRSQ
jgi:hypothetical protein